MSRGLFIAILVVAALAGVGKRLATADRPNAFQDGGDCPYYVEAAESLLHDRDLDLRNQIDPERTGLAKHSGFIAASPDGTIVPKHSVLLPILSLPFLAAFGKIGLLLFNVVQTCLLVYGLAVLGGDTPATRFTALAGYLTAPFLPYTFNYSPDVLGAALVAWAYVAASRRRWAWCGLLAGLAVWAKLYLGVLLLPAALLVIPGGHRAVLTAVVCSVMAVAPMLALNAHLYGSPLTTGYDRQAMVTEDNELVLIDHYSQFNQPALPGVAKLLFDSEIGLLQTAPLWVLWPAGACVLIRRGGADRRLAIALAAAIVANLLIFARYDQWHASIFGNRFLFPALALGLALLGPLAQCGWEWFSKWRRGDAAPTGE
jgi:hypothetical protein